MKQKLDILYQLLFEEEDSWEELQHKPFFEKLSEEEFEYFLEIKHRFFERGFYLGKYFGEINIKK
ncbi:hypothetical protein HMPREF1049_0139 [Fusobacterium necrophorum subsp. funduliforme ATCC 51357]|uniref:Uncharacterized protein n=1 Tax=Fusobacterium necrophorum subsp. funduliforme TaxID=143387 RepID=A0A162IYI1_9FUSO|nr:hypothetical protein [Fusobacterium necrophorum]EIJ71988.1 hypothetical protein HMPREF1049_0139 [Fusobacterium necrophorum subsp. funduliforme ATCC 51357]KAB0553508.1 hypothetical protein F7P76_04105 [Fusobacterium necrophorum subsp. funduliforme]KYL04705.1 hypothetical protein A2J07_05210 [Fusobacterium necrophorum subsp. funduliforme]KYM54835.1 hypothetical protein A2U07_03330 [Fusobacterium necrophorum subsp. funduliforme]MCF0162255.1 hypothetical protein [Fusobacterium necrophorum]